MLKRFIASYLLISFFCTILFAETLNNCKPYENDNKEAKCVYIQKDNFLEQNKLRVEIHQDNGKYKKLKIFVGDKYTFSNNTLLSKSMKFDDVSAEALKNIKITDKKLIIKLGTLRGNNYIEYQMFFEFYESEFILKYVLIHTNNFFNDNESMKFYFSVKKLSLTKLSYIDYFIKDNIFDYLDVFEQTILHQKQPLYKTPSEKTKMYLIKGDKVEILEEKDDWLYILYHGKKDIKAWIPKSAIEETEINQEIKPVSKNIEIKEEKTFFTKLLEFFNISKLNQNTKIMQS